MSRAENRCEYPLMSLQAGLFSEAKTLSRGVPHITHYMHYMQAHNCKLHCNRCTPFARHWCQSKYA